MKPIDRARIAGLMERERAAFRQSLGPETRFPDDRQNVGRRRGKRCLRPDRTRAREGCARTDSRNTDVGGIGGTLAGNALSLASMRATLGEVMTDAAFVRMIALGERFEQGVRGVIESHEPPWHVVRLGCRVEYLFRLDGARNGAEAAA